MIGQVEHPQDLRSAQQGCYDATVGMIVVVIAAVQYLFPLLPVGGTFYGLDYRILIAIGIVIVLNFIAYLGVDTSAAMLMLFAMITLGVLLSIIFPALFDFNVSSLTPFFSRPHILI